MSRSPISKLKRGGYVYVSGNGTRHHSRIDDSDPRLFNLPKSRVSSRLGLAGLVAGVRLADHFFTTGLDALAQSKR